MRITLTLLSLSVVPFFVISCAQESLTGDTFSRAEAGQPQTVQRGTITSVRQVRLEGSDSGTVGGGLLGAVAGGLIGDQVGGGSGRRAARVAGAAGGGIAGTHVGQQATSRRGLEIEVRLDSGRTISVVQQDNPRETFQSGDRVRVLDSGKRARVSH